MEKEYGELFRCMHQFTKLKVKDMFPDVSKNDFMTLMSIEYGNQNENGITISELAEKLHVLPSAISRTLKGMEEKELTERIIRKSDRRNTYVVLTEKGKACLKEGQDIMNNFFESVVEKMKEDDLKRLVAYMDELYQVCESEIALRSRKKETEDSNRRKSDETR